MADDYGIRSRGKLKDWLKDRPVEYAQAIAARTALRALPLVGRVFETSELSDNDKNDLTKTSWRASFISWAARKYPAHDLKEASASAAEATSASEAAFSSASSASASAAYAYAAAYASASAAYAAYAAFAPASAAFADSAAAATDYDYWDSVAADIAWITQHQQSLPRGELAWQLAGRPLWLEGEPNWALDARNRFSTLPIENFEPWQHWYERIIEGKSPFGFGAKIDEVLAIKIAEQDNAFWEQDFGDVNRQIKAWIDEARPKGKKGETPAKKPATVRPIWREGMLYQSLEPVEISLEERIISDFAEGLKAELSSLAEKAAKAGNFDKRVLEYFVETAGMLPPGTPDSKLLFQLVMREALLNDQYELVNQQWPDVLATRYSSLCKQFSRYLDRFADKRKFDRDDLEGKLEAVDLDELQKDTDAFRNIISNDDAKVVIDSSIPNTLQSVGSEIEIAEQGKKLPKEVSDRVRIKKAADQLESMNNITKELVEGGLDNEKVKTLLDLSQEAYDRGFVENIEESSYKAGAEDAAKVVKAINRGRVGATGLGVLLKKFKSKYPSVFDWWKPDNGGN